ncbi:bifunctional diguanylate cyclase/phosphodiesterase [Glaciecola sp. KUL10]|uniref:putative bifunctional diguanylate cyclase/phosphodiesterase n=1 Tax=Glaciecola sp. (strain KUL10) TaxID=2161813 RepID=UPI000D78BE1C|nr:bifunctional diguanylate cyclase/phosphodiesterase [Glaciecola sp. KUL10]GBL04971.1 diguanylate cyclase/phosphodiesterase [Glaciecola sp. KUL10]
MFNVSLLQKLGIADCTILRKNEDGSFSIIDGFSDWVKKLFPESQQPSFTVEGCSMFLDNFLVDAQAHWDEQQPGKISSGIWSEEYSGSALFLEAVATFVDEECYLIITHAEDAHNRQQQTLQVARDLLVSHDQVTQQHEYVIDRLRHKLNDNKAFANEPSYLLDALKHTNVGVIITDEHHQLVTHNPVSRLLFEADGVLPEDPFQILKSLFNNQFPEGMRPPLNDRPWTGEVCWFAPPNLNKWFQVDIHPVKNAENGFNTSHFVYTISDITRIKYLSQSNEKLALTDTLTSLPNRQHFWQALLQNTAVKKPFYVLMIDIVNFKQTNEMFGHAIGDELLIRFKNRLLKRISGRDILARVGADEFAIIHFPTNASQDFKTHFDDAFSLSESIIELSDIPFTIPNDKYTELPIKMGITQFPDDACTPDELITSAYLAVSSAKRNPNKPVEFYTQALKLASDKRIKMVEALSHAIEKEQFELFFQPIIDTHNGKVIKAEALLRWHINDQDTIPPDIFIPLAEESGFIIELGRWVIDHVCEALAKLAKLNLDFPLTLNLSPKQISDGKLVDFISSCMNKYHVPSKRIELEVTEGVLVDNQAKAQQLLQELRKIGLSVSIDDFGTGYSSLSYLKYLPIDHLKIDRSFIADLEKSADDQAIVLAVIAMAQRLKLGVIAEGVENQFQKDFLCDANCTIAQGFLFSKPLPINEFIEYVQKTNQ